MSISFTLVVVLTFAQLQSLPLPPATAGNGLLKSLASYFAKQSGQEVTEQTAKQLSRQVGDTVLDRTTQKVMKEGGDRSLHELGELVANHGPEVLRAVDNVPRAQPVLNALRTLPAEEVATAASRLAAGQPGRELAAISEQLGASVLRAEAKHPGIGVAFARSLGTEGTDVCMKLTTAQAQQIGKHVDDIAQLPAAQRSQLLELISNQSDRFAAFVGRFVEQNPGKVLFTSASTAIILANSDAIFGDGELLWDAEGNLIIASNGKPRRQHPGIVPRLFGDLTASVETPLRLTLYAIGGVIVLLIAAWGTQKLRRSA